MISINKENLDLILQVEDYTNIKKVFESITLDIDNILIICTELFIQRFIQTIHEDMDEHIIDSIAKELEDNNGYVEIFYCYKRKQFNFHFIVLTTESKTINNPFHGDQEINIGFKQIKIN